MLRRFIVFVLLLWLPLQGMAAVTMPFCRHAGDSGATQPAHDDSHAAHHAHAGHEDGVPADQVPSDDHGAGLMCNDCGACHLACAAALRSELAAAALQLITGGLQVRPPLAPPAFVLDQPSPPPLARG